MSNEELFRAISAVSGGEALLDPSTTARVFSHELEVERKTEEDAFRELSDR